MTHWGPIDSRRAHAAVTSENNLLFCSPSWAFSRWLTGLFAIATLLVAGSGAALANDEKGDGKRVVAIVSQPLVADKLPEPGNRMTVSFTLSNTRQLVRTVRALVSRDGRMVEVPVTKSYLNEKERPTYEFEITAPIAELSYRFIAYEDGKPALISQEFAVRRKCLPSLELTDLNINTDNTPSQQIKEMFLKAGELGDEIEHYEKALQHLATLQKLLGE